MVWDKGKLFENFSKRLFEFIFGWFWDSNTVYSQYFLKKIISNQNQKFLFLKIKLFTLFIYKKNIVFSEKM